MKILKISILIVFSLIVWSLGAYAANELVLHLSFDEGSGNVAKDLSKYKNDCALKGNPKWIDGKFGKALELDGKTWGEVPDHSSLDMTTSLTIETWVKLYGGGEGTQSAVEKGSAWIDGEYNLAALYSNGTILQIKDLPEECNDDNIGSNIQDNNWHFLAGTWDGGVIKLYIDGKLDKELPCAGTIKTNDEPLFIGARGGTQRFIIGALDEIKVYNYALTLDELLKDMQNPNPASAVKYDDKLTITWGKVKFY